MPMFQNSFGILRRGPNVDSRFDGQRHARLQHAPLAADFVVAHIVHIQPEPMAGAMIEKRQVGLLLDQIEAAVP